MPKNVAIYGAGVGGLTVAHELAERGLEVDVYEAEEGVGGKARSFRYADGGAPGEHGLRFYPGFYNHLDDTLARIPFAGNRRGVLDNLVTTEVASFCREAGDEIRLFTHFPRSARQLLPYARNALSVHETRIRWRDILFLARRVVELAASCEDRQLAEFERLPWLDFADADPGEETPFYAFLVDGWTRTFTALRPELASSRTLGLTLVRLAAELGRRGSSADRVMNGPTSERWLAPWRRHLEGLGVTFHFGQSLDALELRDGALRRGHLVDAAGRRREVEAAAHVCALPIEVMRRLLTPALRRAAPALAGVERLETRFMGGLQVFLDRPTPLVPGHIHCSDAPWALTAICQSQFWPEVYLGRHAGRRVGECVSICVADWRTPGRFTTAKPAMDCDPDELFREAWAQLRSHLSPRREAALASASILGFGVDPRIAAPATRRERCEPLFVSTVGCWFDRPEAVSEVDGLFLAADYVRTWTDVASMESANEAGRRATNGILAHLGSADRCRVVRPPLVPPLDLLRRVDALRYRLSQRPQPPRRRWRRAASP